MAPLIILLIVGLIVAIGFFSRESPYNENLRKKYLEAMADFLEGRLEKLQRYDNSYKISFFYKEKAFCFEDIEEPGFGRHTYKGYLKAPTPARLTLSFTEQSRSGMRSQISSLSEIAAGGSQDKGRVDLPKALKEFQVYTNDPENANKLLADAGIVKVFAHFKNMDPRGHPVMSLEIIEGVVTLKFHPAEDLTPNLSGLKSNVSSIEGYLDELIPLIDKI